MAKRMKDGQWLKSDAALLQDLADRVQTLPQELYDEIEALVLSTPRTDCLVYITSDWRPPLATQVSRKISDKFAKGYWKNTAFEMKQDELDQWARVASTDGTRLEAIDKEGRFIAKWIGR